MVVLAGVDFAREPDIIAPVGLKLYIVIVNSVQLFSNSLEVTTSTLPSVFARKLYNKHFEV